MTVRTFKRGDDFSLTGRAPPRAGGYTGWGLQCQVRRMGPSGPGDLIATLEATWTDAAAGALLLRATGSTAAWPLGDAALDVRYIPPGSAGVTTDDYVRFRIVDPATRIAP